MGRQRLPVVSESRLLLLEEIEGQPISIPIESEAWFHWLATENNQSFAFRHALGTLTIRRERKRYGWYWYAYQKRNGRLRKAYVVKSEELTLQRLTIAANILAGRDNDDGASVSAPFATPPLFLQD